MYCSSGILSKSVRFDFKGKRNNWQLQNWDGSVTSCYLSPRLKCGQKKYNWTLFRFLEIASDFITMKLQCGLTSF